MLSTVLGYLSGIVNAVIEAMSGIVVLWPVAVMAGFLVLGFAISAVKKLAGARRGKRRGR